MRTFPMLLLTFALAAPVLADEAAPPANAAPADAAATAEPEIMGENEAGQALLARADSYWTARIARDPAVYGFYPPEEMRPEGMKGVPAEGGTVAWSGYAIEAVKVEGDDGLVQVHTQMVLPPEQAARFPEAMKKYLAPTVMERWVRLEGEWYKRPVEPGLSRIMKASRKKAAEAQAAAEQKAAEEAGAATTAGTEAPAQP